MSWHELIGKFGDAAGTAGTVTLPAGAIVLLVSAHSTAGGSFQILGGASAPVIANAATIIYEFDHTLVRATAAANTIVFTGTDHYYVQFYQPLGTSAF